MPKFERSHKIGAILLFICLMFSAGMFLYAMLPHPYELEDTLGNASVQFQVTDNIILSNNDCYTVRWQVNNISAVYLNDAGKIGEGEEQLCYDEVKTPQLQVEFEDGSQKTYQLEIILLQQQPSFWFFLAISIILLSIGVYFIILPTLNMTLQSSSEVKSALLNLISLSIFTIIIVGGVLEFGLRFYFMNFGTNNDRIRYVYNNEELRTQVSRFSGTPYNSFTLNPNYQGHNSLGYRGDEFSITKPENTYRIATIGASTTYGFGVNDNQTYPAVLEKVLHDDFGYTHVEVINAGVQSYTSYEIITNFQFRVIDLNPDLIIYYGAKNDAETRFEDPGCFNDPSPLRGLTTLHGLWRTEFADIPPSTLLRYFMINTGMINPPNSIEFALADIPIEILCDSEEGYTEDELLELNGTQFVERNFRTLLGLAQLNDIDIVVSEFVYPTSLEQVDGDTNLIMSPARQQAVEEIITAYRNIADEMGAYYYPMGDDFVINPGDFWTPVHMRAKATEKQAKLYAQFLHDNNIIPPPETD